MQQIKIFKGLENDLLSLEAEINAWLVESQAHVTNLFGNIAPQSATSEPAAGGGLTKSNFPPSDVLLVMLYDRPA